MIKKLFVAGCSVSDYTNVDKIYGELLSEKLNCTYIHEGAGCGSNWRIWRKIINYIINGDLTSDDLLIIQYTSFERKEFWSNIEKDMITGKIKIREKYKNGGNLIRFKIDSYKWHKQYEKKFLKIYEENFINIDYEKDVFNTQNIMFQELLSKYNIKTIFF